MNDINITCNRRDNLTNSTASTSTSSSYQQN